MSRVMTGRKANSIGRILRENCLLEHITGMCRITVFGLTTDSVYDGGPLI